MINSQNDIFRIFKNYFDQIHLVQEEVLFDYFILWSEVEYVAKTIITGVGEIQRDMYFVLDGVQKSYQISQDKIHVLEFTYFPSLSGIPDSFIMQTPSKYYLETISKSKLLKISYDSHNSFLESNRQIETLFRKITELILFNIIDRYYDLNAYDMKARFTTQLQKRPELLNLVPRKDLASYLRIDSTNLSKLIKSVKI